MAVPEHAVSEHGEMSESVAAFLFIFRVTGK
jgi:hypothetical protein